MKILADECVDKPIVDYLRDKGYKVLYVAEMNPSISDSEVLSLANEKSALLLTSDKDFGELVFRQRSLNRGVILMRLTGFSSLHQARIVFTAIERYYDELMGAFTVITPSSIRIRKIKQPN